MEAKGYGGVLGNVSLVEREDGREREDFCDSSPGIPLCIDDKREAIYRLKVPAFL